MLCLRLPLVAQNTLLRSRGSVEVDWALPLLDSDLENDFVPVDDEALPGDDEGPTGSRNPPAPLVGAHGCVRFLYDCCLTSLVRLLGCYPDGSAICHVHSSDVLVS